MSIMRAKKIILLFSFFPLKASSVSGRWTSSTGGDAFVSQSSFMKHLAENVGKKKKKKT